MRVRSWKWARLMGALVLGLAMIPSAVAQCSLSVKPVKPSAWNPKFDGAHVMRAALGNDRDYDDGASIVGMWHAVFTDSSGSNFDDSVVQWHADGTEIMNSERPAQDGNFCMGVWTRTGERKYVLNHLPWKGNDPSGAPQDGAQLIELITLSPDGNSYTGSYTFVPYAADGTPGPTFTGTITAKRITVNTKFPELL